MRDINSGKMCEIIVEEKGTKAVRATSMDADMLIIGPKGLKQIVEVGAGSDSQHRASGVGCTFMLGFVTGGDAEMVDKVEHWANGLQTVEL